jgi:alkylated DNA nucleotide flippase Atl1
MRKPKSWREKMNNPDLPKFVRVLPRMQARYGNGPMLIPSPAEVEECIRAVPKGRTTTVGRIREDLARRHSVEAACPLTTGIFVRIAAEAAEEDALAGQSEITPYWRVVKDDGSLYDKFPGGVARQSERLMAEGHRIVRGRNGRARVARVAQTSG